MDYTRYEIKKPGNLIKLFWWAAGADPFILQRSTYSDHIKYACLGGIVIATGLMAGLAGGYAFYTIFEPKGSALDTDIHIPTVIKSSLFGMIWGLIIFNIDRFIVTSTGKGDGTEAITKQEIKSAIPRIIMGMIIAITISKPLEIRMFKSEIDAELHARQMEQQAEYKKRIEANYMQFIIQSRDKIKALQQEVREKTALRDETSLRLQEEVAGKTSGSGKTGDGPVARQIRSELGKVEIELADLKGKNEDLIHKEEANLKIWEDKLHKELALGEEVAAKLDGLLERIKLAHKIAGGWITTFIMLLFMAIELTPIFFKLMLVKSPYDYLEENFKEIIKAQQGIEVKYEYYKDKEGLERHLVKNHMAEQLILDKVSLIKAQEELTRVIVNKWIQREKENIEKNLDAYIRVENDMQPEEVVSASSVDETAETA